MVQQYEDNIISPPPELEMITNPFQHQEPKNHYKLLFQHQEPKNHYKLLFQHQEPKNQFLKKELSFHKLKKP